MREAVEQSVKNAVEVLDTGKGWSYVTFFRPGTKSETVLFDLDRLETMAKQNGLLLPWDVVAQHNKIVVTAHSDEHGASAQLFGLAKLLEAFAAKFGDTKKYPDHGFYGKLGGFYDWSEKGRVLVIYSDGDDRLLELLASLEELLTKFKVKGVRFELHLSNGLSSVPRLLDGFHDSTYRQSGANFFRITDPHQFQLLLDQARQDYFNYPFVQPEGSIAASAAKSS